MITASILGTGTASRLGWIQSRDLDRTHGFVAGHIERVTGVARRPYAGDADQIALAAEAGQAALSNAGLDPLALDAVLHAAAVPYQLIPATAPAVQHALGLPDGQVAAYDIGATCLGCLAALQHAAAMIEAQRWTRVLVVASEHVSNGLNWQEPAVAGLFGDGAGAVVLGPGPGGLTVGPVTFATHPSGIEAASLRAGGTRAGRRARPDDLAFQMDGAALFALTRRRFGPFVQGVLQAEGLTLADIDLVVPHQASPAALRLMSSALGVPPGRLIDLSASHGNQIAASLPVTLDHARRAGRIAPGARVLMLGTAAGVSFGAALLRASA